MSSDRIRGNISAAVRMIRTRSDVMRTLDRVLCPVKSVCRERKYESADETGTSEKELLEKYIDRGMPVIFWACIDMREPVTGPQWRLHDTENGSHGYRMSTVCCWSDMMMKNIILTIRTMGTA